MRSGQSYALADRVMDKIAESVRTIINLLKLFVSGLSLVWGVCAQTVESLSE